MFRVFMEEKLITVLMLACMVLSVFLRILLSFLYQNMIRETDNMATTGNKLLKQCKLKFANCYEMSDGVANIPIFVDKFISRLALGRMSFETLYHLSGQIMLLAIVISGVGICKSIIDGRTLGEILPFYIVSFAGLYVFFSVSTLTDIRGKRRVLKVNLVDYLENHLSPRINVTRDDVERLYGTGSYEEMTGMPRRLPNSGGRRRTGAGSADRRKRRTVELMPIGNRLYEPEEAAAGYDSRGGNYTESRVGNGTEGRGGNYTESRVGNGTEGRSGNYGEDYMENSGENSGGRAGSAASTETDNPAAVTEEELEALLKEFLTI